MRESKNEWFNNFGERVLKRASIAQQKSDEILRDRDRFLATVKDSPVEAEIWQALSNAVPEEIEQLTSVADYYAAQCDRCIGAKAFFPACVMAAAMIESMLLVNAFIERDRVTTHPIFLSRSHQKGQPSVFQLQFNELIALSAALNWLPPKAIDQELVRHIRENGVVLDLILNHAKCRKTDLQNPGLVIMKFLQGLRNSIHGVRLTCVATSAGNMKFDSACSFGILAAIEIKTALATQMFDAETKNPR